MKQEFYSLKEIKKRHAIYNWIIGERSNGKTTACLTDAVKEFREHGSQSALIRRWREDFTGKRAEQLFTDIVLRGVISDITGGEYTGVYYSARKWYLCRTDEETGEMIRDPKPFMFGFALTEMEHDKSSAYPEVRIIIFDEAISRHGYLPDEFVIFMNTLSTIIRQRDDVVIYMLGNTVNKYCPYFNEMGLTKIKDMTQGKIDVYVYGDSDLTVAVEYCGTAIKNKKKSDKYFAFDNPRLSMITGGSWEIASYPHAPCKFLPQDILFRYYIKFDGEVLECEIVLKDDKLFTFVHLKTTPLQIRPGDVIFSLEADPVYSHYTNIMRPSDQLTRKIEYFYRTNRVFYSSNDVGEIMMNYLKSCEA